VSLRVGTWCSGIVEDALTTHKNFRERMGEEVAFFCACRPGNTCFYFVSAFLEPTNIKQEGNIKNNQGKSPYNNVPKLTTKK
jgi:hypothetical protein